MNFWKNRQADHSHWTVAFGAATFIVLLIGAHSYIVLSYTGETSKWVDQFLNTVSTWYLWAAFFPFIFRLAGDYRFGRGAKLRSALVHVLAGAGIAMLHAIFQILFTEWFLHSQRSWSDIRIIFEATFTTTFFWRFFVYQAILSVCIALDSYRRARKTELHVSQMEAGILQAQIESLKMQLDPDFLFKSLKHLSNIMNRDPDEAESMVAGLGDYLRMRLDHSGSSLERINALYRSPIRNSTPEASEIPLALERRNDDDILPPAKQFDHSNRVDTDFTADPVQKWLVIIGIFTSLVIYFTIQRMVIHATKGTTMNWPQHLLDYSGWYIWALITPFVLKVSSKYPLRRQNWLKHASIHLIVFVMSWLSATIAMSAVHWAANLGEYSFLDALPVNIARSPFSLDIICYSTIVAIESAVRYHRRFEFGKLRTIRLSAQLARARLQALKMQLHPHFLFNALNSLSELMQEDLVAAEEMIRNLEKFLRLTVNHNEIQEIPFEQELEFLNCYLAIENVRYQDRLSVKMEIEPQAMKVPVPNLMLQPIVENAIRHGIAPRTTPGHIEIQAKRDNGMLRISVRDNGPGLGKSKNKVIHVRSGLGLSNTRERLSQLYGDGHHFELMNVPEGGLMVTVEIPVKI